MESARIFINPNLFIMKKIKLSLLMLAAVCSTLLLSCDTTQEETTDDYPLSLAQWSLHKSFFGPAIADYATFGRYLMEAPDSLIQGDLDPMDFPSIAKGYGINTIELVNTFYFNKADSMDYWKAFKANCEKEGVNVHLIMCDALGNLGDANDSARMAAVENHYKWVNIAEFLGAKSIRVNAAGEGTAEEVAAHAADGLKKLGEYGATKGINVIVENHGGYSSNGEWLAGVMKTVNMDNVGTLPDFGNFCIKRGPDGCEEEYDRYKGITELMPFAKGVSAKTHNFDAEGNETESDYFKIFKIIKDSGFKGYVGIEYEGNELSEDEGIKATKALLDRVLAKK